MVPRARLRRMPRPIDPYSNSRQPGARTGKYRLRRGRCQLRRELRKWRLRAGYKLRDNLGTGAGIARHSIRWANPRAMHYLRLILDRCALMGRLAGNGVLLSSLHYMQLTPVDYQLLCQACASRPALPNGMNGGPDTWEHQLRLSGFVNYLVFKGTSYDSVWGTTIWICIDYTKHEISTTRQAAHRFHCHR